jgi:superfamily II DNA or RNA helicase/HKD family nuclease
MQNSDLTFFTNDENQTLLSRFKATLKDTQYFDVLVGYFRASGFYQLAESIDGVEKTRILVGLGIDRETQSVMDQFKAQTVMDFESHKEAKQQYQETLVSEIENSEESDEKLELGLKQFIEFLKREVPNPQNDIINGGNGRKLEIRAFPSKNIHAKVYVGRYKPEDRDYGFVITGSSNFSYNGLVANREFNVNLKQRHDVEYALNQFENLWKESVDISSEFVDAIEKKTWLNDSITPYELYLKLLYEYLQEDINLQDEIEIFLPQGFMSLQYQQQAVQQAMKKLNEHNGVFLADVVGLGKTFITAQLLQQLRGRILVICPPILQLYWEESLHDFRVPARVESLGKLEKIIEFGINRFDYIVVDEAHRFRNENTASYANLLDICRNKKVILVTATPLNNSIEDIYAQLKLFQSPKDSTIPGIPDLEKFFTKLKSQFKGLDKAEPEYKDAIKMVSKEIRERVLKHVMVRRTRKDVTTYFKKDTESQGLFFPQIKDPQRIVYEYQGDLEKIFLRTIELLQEFSYARYTPLLFYTGIRALSAFEKQQQRNVGGFMKGILIKRLESSVYAFRKSIERFIISYEKFISMFDMGTIYISKTKDVYELLDSDDIDALDQLVNEEKAHKYLSKDFRKDYREFLELDLGILKEIKLLWKKVDADPKMDAFIDSLQSNKTLRKNKLVVFTESKETGDYLFKQLNNAFKSEVIFFSSGGGVVENNQGIQAHNTSISRKLIKDSFDPNSDNQVNNHRILITTDVLAEGINLHRSNVLINYDLPWNPTRVLQRAGRVNRLGTTHDHIFIYNFFPTTQTDAHLGLEANITSKIQMFHDILGEDAKYLSDGEEIGSQELFDTLNRKQSYSGEEEVDSELKYLEIIRTIRDKQPDLFEKVKLLPKKARCGMTKSDIKMDQMISFFRIGPLKKFYQNQKGHSKEITFFDAARELECQPETPKISIPNDYHHLLETNKQKFQEDMIQNIEDVNIKGGQSNYSYIERRLKEKSFKNFKGFTEIDEEFLEGVRNLLGKGLIAKKTAQTIKKAFEKTLEPMDVLHILRTNIRDVSVAEPKQKRWAGSKKEIILSSYQSVEHK